MTQIDDWKHDSSLLPEVNDVPIDLRAPFTTQMIGDYMSYNVYTLTSHPEDGNNNDW